MTAAPPIAFPGGRVLAGWWRQLAPEIARRGPVRGVWFAHLFLHRVESLFEVNAGDALDPLARLLLRALALSPARTAADLDASLHLGPAVVHRLLRGLHATGLAEQAGRGEWSLTDEGCRAQGENHFVRTERRRRVIYFVEDRPAGARAQQPPHFLNVNAPGAGPLAPGEEWRFDPAVLEGALRQPDEWKRRHEFPADLRRLLAPEPADAGDQWNRVILDRPEHLAVLLVLAGEGPGRLLGFAVRSGGWVLPAVRPAFELGPWQEVFPDLAEEPAAELWQQAWRAWCQPRNLPANEVEACQLRREGHVLRVQAPAKLVERLRAARSDAVKGEAWLLAGAGPIRPATVVELVEGGG